MARIEYFKTLIAVAVLGSMLNPFSAVLALACLLAYQLIEKHYVPKEGDKDLKEDLKKLKTKVEGLELGKAFKS